MNNIHIKDQNSLNKKIEKIKEDGLNSLHLVSDYDRTLTYCFNKNKEKRPSVISLIRSGGYLTKEYPKQAFALFDKYHPYEIDKNLDFKTKCEKMQEWWTTHRKLLIKSGMNKGVIEDILKNKPSLIRNKTKELFEELNNHNVPILILSAGVGNMIKGYLKQENILFKNIKIVSNLFTFNKEGKATGYKDKIIHVFNKSEASIPKEYKDKIKDRKNVILLGDSLEDVNMTDGIEHNEVIKIGFLNEKIEENLETYKETFDIVITNDQDMSYVLELFEKLNSIKIIM